MLRVVGDVISESVINPKSCTQKSNVLPRWITQMVSARFTHVVVSFVFSFLLQSDWLIRYFLAEKIINLVYSLYNSNYNYYFLFKVCFIDFFLFIFPKKKKIYCNNLKCGSTLIYRCILIWIHIFEYYFLVHVLDLATGTW